MPIACGDVPLMSHRRTCRPVRHAAAADLFDGRRLLLSQQETTAPASVGDDVVDDNRDDDGDGKTSSDVPYVMIDCEEQGLSVLDEMVRYLCGRRHCVAVSGEGVLLGRGGRLSLLCLSSERLLVVIDLVQCRGERVITLLRPLLESQRVTKVMHDCRLLSDLLWHQYNVRLAGVFDTHAAAVCVSNLRDRSGAAVVTGEKEGEMGRERGGEEVPVYSPGLAHTLVDTLRLHESQVVFTRYRSDQLPQDQSVWLHRPLSRRLLLAAVANVRYLCRLRQAQLVRWMRPLARCADVYLSAVRDADDETAADAPYEVHRVPVGVRQIISNTRTQNLQQQHERQCHNVVKNLDAGFMFTRNVWHSR